MAIVVQDLIEQHVSKYLGDIFSTSTKTEPFAAEAVFRRYCEKIPIRRLYRGV